MKNSPNLFIILLCFTILFSCKSEDETTTEPIEQQKGNNNTNSGTTSTLTVKDFTATVQENKASGETIEKLSGNSTTEETITYSIKSSDGDGAIKLESDGTIKVDDSAELDFEKRQKITVIVNATNGKETKELTLTINITDVDETTTSNSEFKNNKLRQLTGTVRDIPLQGMKVIKYDPNPTSYNDASNTEKITFLNILDTNLATRFKVYFSGIIDSNTDKTYTSTDMPATNFKLKPGEFIVEKVTFGSNKNYWWKPNTQHTMTIKVTGENVVVEINDFEIGGGIGSIGTEKFNAKFKFKLSGYEVGALPFID